MQTKLVGELQSKLSQQQQDPTNVMDDEEPFVLDGQEERELHTQVCQLAAEVCMVIMHIRYSLSHDAVVGGGPEVSIIYNRRAATRKQ